MLERPGTDNLRCGPKGIVREARKKDERPEQVAAKPVDEERGADGLLNTLHAADVVTL